MEAAPEAAPPRVKLREPQEPRVEVTTATRAVQPTAALAVTASPKVVAAVQVSAVKGGGPAPVVTDPAADTKASSRLPPFEWMVEGDTVEEGWEVQVNFNRAAEAKVVRNSHLYRGRVAAVNEDGTFKIDYADGDEEDSVRREWVKWRRELPAAAQLLQVSATSTLYI